MRGCGVEGSIGTGEPAGPPLTTSSEVREKVRFDRTGQYRPLSGARGLPTGWHAVLSDGLTMDDAIEAVYPLATIHRAQFEDGSLRVVGLDDVLSRQSGRYEGAAQLSSAGRALVRDVLCNDVCVRVPVWAGLSAATGEIPCPEPCSALVALAREASLWEQDPPELTTPDPTVEFAEFEVPGNVVRETYLRRARGEGATS